MGQYSNKEEISNEHFDIKHFRFTVYCQKCAIRRFSEEEITALTNKDLRGSDFDDKLKDFRYLNTEICKQCVSDTNPIKSSNYNCLDMRNVIKK